MTRLGLRSICACALLTACAISARAQLVFGSTTTATTNSCAMYLNVNTLEVTTLWNSAAQKKVNGMASDPVSGRLYCNDAARLNYWNYGSVGVAPTLIAGMYRTTDNITFTATGVDGLAFANGNLYGATSFGSTVFTRGIYQIATTADGGSPPHCVMTQIWSDPTASPGVSGLLALGGLDFNTADGLFYAVNAADTTSSGFPYTRGLYSIDAFGSGAITHVADFPPGRTKIDGLAIGGGKYWMTEQDPNQSRIAIYPYDPGTGNYGATIFVPLADTTQRATGAAWAPNAIPEPASAGLLVLLGLATRRR